MSISTLFSCISALLALSAGLGGLLGLGSAPRSALALAAALLALAAALAASRARGKALAAAARLPPPPTAAAPADHSLESQARIEALEASQIAELAALKEATRLVGASALRRLDFADSVLKKVPTLTEEAAFDLMQRLVALRDQSSGAARAAADAGRESSNAEAIMTLASAARATMGSVRAALKEMRKHDRDAASGLKSLGSELKSGIELLAGIEEITERSRLIAFNMAIEAARIGEKGRGFKVIVGELRALNDRTADFSKQVVELLGRFKKYNESLVEVAIASSLQVAEQVEKGIGEEEQAIESLLGASTSCVDLSDSVTETVKRINIELDGVLESLQFQDITRQMIEGALATIGEAEGDLAPLASRDHARGGEAAAEEEDRRLTEALRAALLARAKTRGEKAAIQEVRR